MNQITGFGWTESFFDPTVTLSASIVKSKFYALASVAGVINNNYYSFNRDFEFEKGMKKYLSVFMGVERKFQGEFWGFNVNFGGLYSTGKLNGFVRPPDRRSQYIRYEKSIVGFQLHFLLTARIIKNLHVFWDISQQITYHTITSNYQKPEASEGVSSGDLRGWDSGFQFIDGVGVLYKF